MGSLGASKHCLPWRPDHGRRNPVVVKSHICRANFDQYFKCVLCFKSCFKHETQLHLFVLHTLVRAFYIFSIFFFPFLFPHVCFLFVFSFSVPDILVHLLPPVNGSAGKIQVLGGGKRENGWLFFHSIEQSWLLLPFLTLQYYWN